MVNSAFAYAIANMQSGDTLSDFFDYVISRYYQFRVTYSYLDVNDYERIGNVLSRHCVGWSDKCGTMASDYRHLPGHTLPTYFTHKTSFQDPGFNQSHFLRAEQMSKVGVTTTAFGAVDGLGYVSLDSSGDEIYAWVTFPSSGYYRFRASVKTGGSCCNSARIGIDNNTAVTWNRQGTPTGYWSWTTGSKIYVHAGTRRVRLYYLEDLDVEALLIEPQSGRIDGVDL